MEVGHQLGLKSHFVLTVDDGVVQLVPVCSCLYEEGVFQLLCRTYVLLLFLAYLFVTFDVSKSLLKVTMLQECHAM